MNSGIFISGHRAAFLLAMVAVYLNPVAGYSAGEPAPIPKTGQTTSYNTGDDGTLQKGLAWPTPRFRDMEDGTITDLLTGLIWLKNANCWGTMSWSAALTKIANFNSGAATCTGYTGGQNDWRLPSINELESLVDTGNSSPAVPTGHLFTGVQSNVYWSGSTFASSTGSAWNVNLILGNVVSSAKTGSSHVWPVRGGQ